MPIWYFIPVSVHTMDITQGKKVSPMSKERRQCFESDIYLRGSYSDLKREIDRAKEEIETADNLFRNASDPDLIDSYIFQGNAARKRYSFLLKQAKILSLSSS